MVLKFWKDYLQVVWKKKRQRWILQWIGLRSIRYWKELYGVKSILVNDIEEEAVESIWRNLSHNGIDTTRVVPNKGDATWVHQGLINSKINSLSWSMVMYEHRQPGTQFDVIDLDPYGSAAMFLDSAVQSVSEGGNFST